MSFKSLVPQNFRVSYSVRNNLSKSVFSKPSSSTPLPEKIFSIYSVNCKGCDVLFLLNTKNGNVLSSLNSHLYSKHSLISAHCSNYRHVLDLSSVKVLKSCKKDHCLPTYQSFVLRNLMLRCKDRKVISIGHDLRYKGLFEPFKLFGSS